MITHPDPETNAIFNALEQQRDEAVVRAAKLVANVKSLEGQLATAAERIAVAETALAEARAIKPT